MSNTNTTCYWPNGGGIAENYTPCDTGTSVSHCCNSNAYCFANGLCLDSTQMTTYRGACTDETWESAACPRYCLDFGDGSLSTGVCGVWACNNNNEFACDTCNENTTDTFTVNGGSILRNEAFNEALTTTSTAVSISPATSSTATSGSTSTSNAQGPSSVASCIPASAMTSACPSNTGAYAGIGAGLGIPLLISLVALAFMFMQLRKLKNGATQKEGLMANGMPVHAQNGYLQSPPAMSNVSQHSGYYSPGSGWEQKPAAPMGELSGINDNRSELPSTTS